MNENSTSSNFLVQPQLGDTSTVELAESRLKDANLNGYHPSHQKNTNIQASPSVTVSEAIVKMLEDFGVKYAFGVAGGAMAKLWGSLSNSQIQVLHFRHEAGAAFAAVEASLASDRPVVVFTTAGPGITNALTGILAARGEGAKVILLSASTSASQRGRYAIQETNEQTIPGGEILTSGGLFDYAATLACAEQLPQAARKMALGLTKLNGFVAHLSIPTDLQSNLVQGFLPKLDLSLDLTIPSKETIAKCIHLLTEGTFAIWVGFGARFAAEEIRQLAERTGAAVMCSPRGKGIFPEEHPQFVGVTGLGGHASVFTYMREQSPLRILVLGTRLGEPTSFWSSQMIPLAGFVHVDINLDALGVAYPSVPTFPVLSDVKTFVKSMLQYFPETSVESKVIALPNPEHPTIQKSKSELVNPEVLMQEIQQVCVDHSDAIVMAESGNSFTWATHLLRFAQPNRYRVSTGVGAMGHAVTGILGAAKARNGKAIAIVGDGAMLMNNEINTAVKYQIPAVWIVLNDACYNMCVQGMAMLGLEGADAAIPQVDFVMIARAMGADGIRVERESDIRMALEQALAASTPFVVDVIIDSTRQAPSRGRNQALLAQRVATSPNKHFSFPLLQ
ncbi:thiamine pyrophosphate-dependent enzyme [Cylindrospermum sp. FACHB-282]|uniref:thiamine pyrophosphate-dependent enzyme n=1 Tax=Cylindrospermum sp. FACHB-282 TaxID=2692794 RepID=UPI001688258C|nr:thiamine pyrophosphate-dependent enzyme [Cylindrospermum sp. FACHB-282]MBD2388683.1 thiamine pyrophosphate-binding protein [Cylindrospermum sp. FACHB-282]